MDLRNLKKPDLKKMDKKLLARLTLAFGAIIALVIIIIIIKLIIGNRVGYDTVEEKMVQAAKEYYSENESGIENFKKISKGEIKVSTDTLVEEGYLKELSKIIPDKEISCSGKVTVKMNNGYTLYSPYLDCGDAYKTKYLNEVITSNIVESGNGLYKIENDYVFRGEELNNHLKFADKDWLILRVRENGNIRLIELTKREKIAWDDRYNVDVTSASGINDFNVSRIKDYLIGLYNNNEEFNDIQKGYIVPTNLCIGKRNPNETKNDGSVECSEVVENWPLGLIQVNEYMIASLDSNCHISSDRSCENYNYFTDIYSSYWSITTGANRSDKVYKLNPSPFDTSASSEASVRAVIELDPKSIYVSGDGSIDNPYIIK